MEKNKTSEYIHLNQLIYENKNSISAEVCDEIINIYENENIGNDAKYEGHTASGLNKNIKHTMDLLIKKGEEKWYKIHQLLERELTSNMLKYKEMLNSENSYNDNQNSSYIFSFLNHNILSTNCFMVQRYIKDIGRYVYHDDFSIDWDNRKYRVITFIWYLNNVEEGGETEFWGDIKIKPEKGKLVLFPASWTFPHCGRVPLSANKYIITGWLYANILDFEKKK